MIKEMGFRKMDSYESSNDFNKHLSAISEMKTEIRSSLTLADIIRFITEKF